MLYHRSSFKPRSRGEAGMGWGEMAWPAHQDLCSLGQGSPPHGHPPPPRPPVSHPLPYLLPGGPWPGVALGGSKEDRAFRVRQILALPLPGHGPAVGTQASH